MAKKTFESALKQLEAITTALESGELSLEASLKKFEEGVGLVQFCAEKLDQARQKVEMLVQEGDRLERVEFEEGDDGRSGLP